jgi:hypothetical protein
MGCVVGEEGRSWRDCRWNEHSWNRKRYVCQESIDIGTMMDVEEVAAGEETKVVA